LIDVIVRQLKASYQLDPHDIAVVVMASTGLAAFNVNGCTIHKFFKIGVQHGANINQFEYSSDHLKLMQYLTKHLKLLIFGKAKFLNF
jgi:hypothetical protein